MPDAWQHFLVTLEEMKRANSCCYSKVKEFDVYLYMLHTYILLRKTIKDI